MAEYISREAAMLAISKQKGNVIEHPYNVGLGRAQSIISNIPAADVAEVRHGHWKNAKGKFRDCEGGAVIFIISATCSVCGRQVNEVYWRGNPPKETLYCPHCGARMDESEGKNNV